MKRSIALVALSAIALTTMPMWPHSVSSASAFPEPLAMISAPHIATQSGIQLVVSPCYPVRTYNMPGTLTPQQTLTYVPKPADVTVIPCAHSTTLVEARTAGVTVQDEGPRTSAALRAYNAELDSGAGEISALTGAQAAFDAPITAGAQTVQPFSCSAHYFSIAGTLNMGGPAVGYQFTGQLTAGCQEYALHTDDVMSTGTAYFSGGPAFPSGNVWKVTLGGSTYYDSTTVGACGAVNQTNWVAHWFGQVALPAGTKYVYPEYVTGCSATVEWNPTNINFS